MAMFAVEVVVLDVQQTETRGTDTVPTHWHDALNRVLHVLPCSSRLVM